MMSIRILGLVFVIILLVSPALADDLNVTVETGETWIRFSWDAGNTYNVTIDSTETHWNVTDNFFILSDLNPSEMHVMVLKNATGIVATRTAYTTPSLMLIALTFIISLLFTIFTAMTSDLFRAIITGTMGATVAAITAYLASGSLLGLSLIAIALAVINGAIVILILYDKKQEKEKYHG